MACACSLAEDTRCVDDSAGDDVTACPGTSGSGSNSGETAGGDTPVYIALAIAAVLVVAASVVLTVFVRRRRAEQEPYEQPVAHNPSYAASAVPLYAGVDDDDVGRGPPNAGSDPRRLRDDQLYVIGHAPVASAGRTKVCAYRAADGLACSGAAYGGSGYCQNHGCPAPGCAASKSWRQPYCPAHVHLSDSSA